jgi:hypothetical protein
MTTLNKQAILQVQDVVIEKVPVPEWGGDVCVRSITAAERGLIEAAAAQFSKSKGNNDFAKSFTVTFAAKAMCDEKGERIFRDDEVALLAAKNASAISRIAEVAQRLSGFSKKEMEELEKNSETAQPEGSHSD